ncbi:MAG: alkaline phosphatase family protein [Candidatus Eisenbacteria sp.]|nr:alkaline phosphatase family protein [Candidatus Eisenbacteria bacterium]
MRKEEHLMGWKPQQSSGTRLHGWCPPGLRPLVGLSALLGLTILLTAAHPWKLLPRDALAQDAQTTSARIKRVIVLGIDGVDHRLMTKWMNEGRLPSFQRLSQQGDFNPLRTSMPPQSPVAWANFITGMNAGGHAIFDFLHRNARTYLPFASMSEVLPAEGNASFLGIPLPGKVRLPFSNYVIPFTGGTTKNLRKGTAFWEILESHDVHSIVHRIPVNFPPVGGGAVTLSGMGTPDIQGTNGTYAYYTTAPGEDYESASGGKIFPVDVVNGTVEARLYGPPNDFIDYDRIQKRTGRRVPYQERKASIPFTVYVDAEKPVAKIVIDGMEIFLEEGVFSPWVELNFSLLPTPGFIRWVWRDLVNVKGTVRFYLKSAQPDFGLYVTPIQISPMHPALPISTPPGYAAELAEAIGPYYTQGMPQDSKALDRDIFNNADYMKQLYIILDEETRMAEYELSRFREGFLFLYFCSIDQTGHSMWRTMAGQENHPAYVKELDDPYKNVYPELYEYFDDFLAQTMDKYIDEETCLFIVSDHGFASWERAFNLNRWLYDNGYLSLKAGTAPSSVSFLQGVDWNNTRLYGLGINGLYVNQLGREKYGVVPPGPSKDALLKEVAAKLEGIIDSKTGEHPISKAYLSREIYSGLHVEEGPDIQVGYHRGYRTSDASAVGELGEAWLSDNTRRWSGDHCQDYRELPGILFTNFQVKKPEPALIDIAPTVLKLFGVTPPEEMEGRPLF